MAVTTQTPSKAQLGITGAEKLLIKDFAQIGTITTGVKMRFVVTEAAILRGMYAKVGTTGSSGSTVLVVNKNGSAVTGLTLTIANTDADGTAKTDGPTAETTLAAGDVVDVEVTAAPGSSSGQNLTGYLVLAKILG
jgi:hypothetical protein